MEAIGLFETRGLTPAVVSLDTMVKAANARLVDMKIVGSGLVCVIIEGNVSAVKSAIEAGKELYEGNGALISYNVIPRPHSDLARMF
ncbi:ethanolamine utilization protein EutM [Aneurinibacillus migulanus]|uniref:BMC domain-containing protein n=1 Tax=Aneurinibacillus migulanus TaxID=47500 RepID=A0A0D1XUK7_ANEMI|nr:BMC domain-containing protein [Aneurinibacillus migulanus]KIV53319.1 carboxysome structural protein EutM [Aneurinibacillus migulanus]KIV57881.1 carboxysome structural protein EutM [Aneurinibacillus migulanus]KON97360.1 carboxysome structural protein EutM [Aneurinibacillus migulanus]KPD05149.1 ethanolamine utilization protein EutM [Aneurinibacillus migulanus]MCP1356345.1 BMC domain-containing protein [Aneurinibacillus migulanus]